jgi:hypothetical protein
LKFLFFSVSAGFVFFLNGCGLSSSSTSLAGAPAAPVAAAQNFVAGSGFKGPFRAQAQIRVDLLNSSTGALTATTLNGTFLNDQGDFRLPFGNHTGTFVLSAGGDYMDEATNSLVSAAAVSSMVVINSAPSTNDATIPLVITPLTHMATHRTLERVNKLSLAADQTRIAAELQDSRQIIENGLGLAGVNIFTTTPGFTSSNTGEELYANHLAIISKAAESQGYSVFSTSGGFLNSVTSEAAFEAMTVTLSAKALELSTSTSYALFLKNNYSVTDEWISTNSAQVLTQATQSFTRPEIPLIDQHLLFLSATGTTISTIETASFTATIMATQVISDLSYTWSVAMTSGLWGDSTKNWINLADLSTSNYGFSTLSSASITKTSSVSFWAAVTGNFSIRVEASRPGYNTVTETADMLVTPIAWRTAYLQNRYFAGVDCATVTQCNALPSPVPTTTGVWLSATTTNWHYLKTGDTGFGYDTSRDESFDVNDWYISPANQKYVYLTSAMKSGATTVCSQEILQKKTDGFLVKETEAQSSSLSRWFEFDVDLAAIEATIASTWTIANSDFSAKSFTHERYTCSAFSTLLSTQELIFSEAASGIGTGTVRENGTTAFNFRWQVSANVLIIDGADENFALLTGNSAFRHLLRPFCAPTELHDQKVEMCVYSENAYLKNKGYSGDFGKLILKQ